MSCEANGLLLRRPGINEGQWKWSPHRVQVVSRCMVCREFKSNDKINYLVCVCVPVFVSLAPRSPTESDLFWISMPVLVETFPSLLKVSAEAVKRYRSEHITFPKGLLGGSHFMCQTPSFQDKYLTCFVTWLNLHVFPSGLLLSEALCCEMKITGICLPNAVIQRIVN